MLGIHVCVVRLRNKTPYLCCFTLSDLELWDHTLALMDKQNYLILLNGPKLWFPSDVF